MHIWRMPVIHFSPLIIHKLWFYKNVFCVYIIMSLQFLMCLFKKKQAVFKDIDLLKE